MRTKLSICLVFILLALVAVARYPERFKLAHFTNQDFETTELDKIYLMYSKKNSKCRLTKRYFTTLRRSHQKLKRLRQQCLMFGKRNKSWAILDKQTGLQVLVHPEDLERKDFFEEFQTFKSQGKLNDWPEITRAGLYVQRLYQGAYLNIKFSNYSLSKQKFEYLILEKEKVRALDHKLRRQPDEFQNLIGLGRKLPFARLNAAEKQLWQNSKSPERLAVLAGNKIRLYPLPFKFSSILLASRGQLPHAILHTQLQDLWRQYER